MKKGLDQGAIIQKYARVRSAEDLWTARKFDQLKLKTSLLFISAEAELNLKRLFNVYPVLFRRVW